MTAIRTTFVFKSSDSVYAPGVIKMAREAIWPWQPSVALALIGLWETAPAWAVMAALRGEGQKTPEGDWLIERRTLPPNSVLVPQTIPEARAQATPASDDADDADDADEPWDEHGRAELTRRWNGRRGRAEAPDAGTDAGTDAADDADDADEPWDALNPYDGHRF